LVKWAESWSSRRSLGQIGGVLVKWAESWSNRRSLCQVGGVLVMWAESWSSGRSLGPKLLLPMREPARISGEGAAVGVVGVEEAEAGLGLGVPASLGLLALPLLLSALM
jgi:hypothetical protein